MAQRVPTAGRCPKILFCIVMRSLACFWRALGCCVRRLAISAFVCPWPNFLTLPPRNALHSMRTKSLKLQPSSSTSAKCHTRKHEEHARNHEDLPALWVAFNAEGMHQLGSCTLSMFQSLSMLWCCDSVTRSPQKPCRKRIKRPMARKGTCFCCLSNWNSQNDHNTMRTIQLLDLSRLWPLQWSGTVGKGHPFSNAVMRCAFPASKHLKSLELLKHAQLACHCAGFHDPGPRWNHQSSTYLSNTLALNFPESSPIAYCISATFSNIDVVYELTDNAYVLGDALAITALQTKVSRGRLSLIRIEDHKE